MIEKAVGSSTDSQVFTDLLRDINNFDLENRHLIDSKITQSTSLENFLELWESLTLKLSNHTILSGSYQTNTIRTPHTNQEKERYLCALKLVFNGQTALHLQFWVMQTPYLSTERSESPIRMYHTKVTPYKVKGIQHFEYYDTIMYLLRKIMPTGTKLLLYVRQKDSLKMLEEGADGRTVPLSLVFQKAGWEYLEHSVVQRSKDPLRKHRLEMKTK